MSKREPITADNSYRVLCQEIREADRARRLTRGQEAMELLRASGLPFESPGRGADVVLVHDGKTFFYWPTTGTWLVKGTRFGGRGIRSLLKACGVEPPARNPSGPEVRQDLPPAVD